MSLTPDQVNTAIIGVASLAVAGLSFVYASRAQAATKRAEALQAHVADATVDAQAYTRAKDLYESALKSMQGQNESLRAEITDLAAAKAALARRVTELDRRLALFERAARDAGLILPPLPDTPEG